MTKELKEALDRELDAALENELRQRRVFARREGENSATKPFFLPRRKSFRP